MYPSFLTTKYIQLVNKGGLAADENFMVARVSCPHPNWFYHNSNAQIYRSPWYVSHYSINVYTSSRSVSIFPCCFVSRGNHEISLDIFRWHDRAPCEGKWGKMYRWKSISKRSIPRHYMAIYRRDRNQAGDRVFPVQSSVSFWISPHARRRGSCMYNSHGNAATAQFPSPGTICTEFSHRNIPTKFLCLISHFHVGESSTHWKA